MSALDRQARARLRAGYRAARSVTREHARTFYLASAALGPARARGAFAVYAFCRRVDDAIDEAHGRPPAELAARIAALRLALGRVYSHAPLTDPELLALRDSVRRFGIERRPFDELIDGVAADIEQHRQPTGADLDRYCYQVAGTVGLMMARLFGVADERALGHAIDLGKAMQYTNILRDVREDYATRNRVYLPEDRMRAHGVTDADLGAPGASAGLRALAQELGEHARALYRSADQGVPLITSASGRAATAIMRAGYSEILAVLEARGWDVLAPRAVVPASRRVALAAGAIARVVRDAAVPA